MKYYKVNGGIIATSHNVDGEEISLDSFKELKEQFKIPALSKEEQEEIERNAPPTAEERLEAVEAAFLELAEVLFNG